MSTVLNAGYRGPTTVKPALCLDPTLGAWALGGSSQGLHGLVEVSPSCPAPINSPESSVISGEAVWTVRGAHLYHAFGTSQVRTSGPDLCLLQGLNSNYISGALGAHLDHLELEPPQSRPTISLCMWNNQSSANLIYLCTIL